MLNCANFLNPIRIIVKQMNKTLRIMTFNIGVNKLIKFLLLLTIPLFATYNGVAQEENQKPKTI